MQHFPTNPLVNRIFFNIRQRNMDNISDNIPVLPVNMTAEELHDPNTHSYFGSSLERGLITSVEGYFTERPGFVPASTIERLFTREFVINQWQVLGQTHGTNSVPGNLITDDYFTVEIDAQLVNLRRSNGPVRLYLPLLFLSDYANFELIRLGGIYGLIFSIRGSFLNYPGNNTSTPNEDECLTFWEPRLKYGKHAKKRKYEGMEDSGNQKKDDDDKSDDRSNPPGSSTALALVN